jgi:hypothetical protein
MADHLHLERREGPGGTQASHRPPPETVWNQCLVKRILQNPKYIGKVIWNKTTQELHPRTGATVTRKRDESEWVHVDMEALRIVSDELWSEVQERLKIVNEKVKAHRLGGLNRAKRKDYLFSGLLVCGVCGSAVNISGCGGLNPRSTYECVSARYKRGCTNKLRFREDRLAAQLVHALSTQLLNPEVKEYLVASVAKQLDDYLRGAASDRDSSRETLAHRVRDLEAAIRRLIDFMTGPEATASTALPQRLAELEAELKQAKIDLTLVSTPKVLEEVNRDLAKLVDFNIQHLLEILKQDVSKARKVLQHHIKHLRLVPVDTGNGPGYEVHGDIDLFRPPHSKEGSVLLDRSCTGTIQQYTNHLLKISDVTLYARGGISADPLVEPLSNLLRQRPELLHMPLSAGSWAQELSKLPASQLQFLDRLDAHSLTKDFRNGRSSLREKLKMTAFAYCRVEYYMFSETPPDLLPIAA